MLSKREGYLPEQLGYHFALPHMKAQLLVQVVDKEHLYDAFTGFEAKNLPFTAVWAAIPNHSLSKKVLNYYESRVYNQQEPPNTLFISDIICNEFNIDKTCDMDQTGFDGIHHLHVFASTYFCLDLPPNVATHHFIGSWLDKSTIRRPYKQHVHNQYHLSNIEPDFLLENNHLKYLATQLSFKNILTIIRHYLKSKFRKNMCALMKTINLI